MLHVSFSLPLLSSNPPLPLAFSLPLSPPLPHLLPSLCPRLWLMKASVCWSTAQTAGTGRLRPAQWPVCCWTRSTEPPEASW